MSKSVDAILAQYERNKQQNGKGSATVDFSKYFNAVLDKNEKQGQARFRILPEKNESGEIVEAHFHSIQVKGQWRKFYCSKHNDNERCPLCEAEAALKSTGREDDKELAKQFRARKFYIIKGIDRANEKDGVKFWRFPHNFKGEGIMDKLIPIITQYGEIMDLKTGRDLIIYMAKDGKTGGTKVTSIMPADPSVIGVRETALEWVKDVITWKDVFKSKPVEYLEIVARGEEPVWSEEIQKFISRDKVQTAKSASYDLDKGLTTAKDDGESFDLGGDDDSDLPF